MCAPSLNRFSSNSGQKHIFYFLFLFFALRFLLRPWGICSFCFSSQNVHIFQGMWSNFINNPFCYFSIFNSISKSQISPIICVNVHESMQNIFFLCVKQKKSLVFSANFFWIRHLGGQVSLGHSLQYLPRHPPQFPSAGYRSPCLRPRRTWC